MFSEQDIIDQADEFYSDEYMEDFKERVEDQKDLEEYLLSDFNSCPAPKEAIWKHVDNANLLYLGQLTQEQVYNPDVFNMISCISESLTTVSPTWKEYIQSYITNLKRIGSESANGVAMVANLHNDKSIANSLFVLKAPKEKKKSTSLLHEAAVGMLVLNHLRQYIPNFAYIYGYFNYGSPVINNRSGDVLQWGGDNGDVGYVIYENINNSSSIRDLLLKQKLNNQKFLNYFIQFLYALKTASNFCNFTHYDCHDENILIKPLGSNKLISYPDLITNGEPIYIKTDAVVTFIDYGFTYVETAEGNKLGGGKFLEKYSTFNDRSFIVYDIFKFLGFCLLDMTDSMVEELIPLWGYMIELPTDKSEYVPLLNRQRDFYFSAPYNNEKAVDFDIDEYIAYCLSWITTNNYTSPIVTPKSNSHILNCQETYCIHNEDLLNDVMKIYKTIPISINPIILLKQLEGLSTSDLDELLDKFVENYPNSLYNECIDLGLSALELFTKELDNIPHFPDIKNYKIKNNQEIAVMNWCSTCAKFMELVNALEIIQDLYNFDNTDKLVNSLPKFLLEKAKYNDVYTSYYNSSQMLLAYLKRERDVINSNISETIKIINDINKFL